MDKRETEEVEEVEDTGDTWPPAFLLIPTGRKPLVQPVRKISTAENELDKPQSGALVRAYWVWEAEQRLYEQLKKAGVAAIKPKAD